MPSLPPRRSDTPRQPVCDMPCSLHPGRRDSTFGTIFLRGHFWVHSRYGLMTRSPSHGWLCRLALSASFPPRMQPKLQGSVSYPGGTPLPLKMPAFAGRARPQKENSSLSGLLHQAIFMMQAAKHRLCESWFLATGSESPQSSSWTGPMLRDSSNRATPTGTMNWDCPRSASRRRVARSR